MTEPGHSPERSRRDTSFADAIYQPASEQGVPDQGESDALLSQSEPASPDTDKAPGPALGDTVGTGTIIAFGCIGATLFLIVVGLVILLLLKMF